MKEVFFSTLTALFFACACSCSPIENDGLITDENQAGSGETDGYKLVWQDLFDGSSLDASAWNAEVRGDGCGNRELEFYTDREENVTVGVEPSTGRNCLILTARKESYGGKQFTSARLTTQGKKSFKYGKIEASIMLPKTADGLWPAFWTLGADINENPWPLCGEIDIVEMGNATGISNGTQETYMNGACHWGTSSSNHPNYAVHSNAPYSVQDGNFHLFTLVWDEEYIRMYLDLDERPDASPYYEMRNNVGGDYFHKEHFILLNLAVGGTFPNILSSSGITALQESGDEAKMYVDYVRVYQK